MPLTFLDARLYSDAAFCAKHFTWTAAEAPRETTIYHAYWDGALTAHHELSLASLVLTQSPPFEIRLWTRPESVETNRRFLRERPQLNAYITLQPYVPEDEAAGTLYAGHESLLHGDDRFRIAYHDTGVYVANGLRLLALAKYGGLYFDLDTLFLEDLRPLLSTEFFYQWSDQPYGNSALLRLRKDSAYAWALVERSLAIGSCRPHALLPFDALSELPGNVHVLPSFVFDPLWIAHDRGLIVNDYCNRFEEFFIAPAPASMRLATFFPGAYAYHWHNYWTLPIVPGTIAARLRDEIFESLASPASPGAGR